jgi:hypothetical protein
MCHGVEHAAIGTGGPMIMVVSMQAWWRLRVTRGAARVSAPVTHEALTFRESASVATRV